MFEKLKNLFCSNRINSLTEENENLKQRIENLTKMLEAKKDLDETVFFMPPVQRGIRYKRLILPKVISEFKDQEVQKYLLDLSNCLTKDGKIIINTKFGE